MPTSKTETKKMLKNMEERKIMSEGSKFYQYKEEINGTEYVFQFPGHRMVAKITDMATIIVDGQEKRSREKLIELMFQHIVVSPAVSYDYFDEHDQDFERVVEIASEFMGGNFRNIRKPE